MKRRGNALKGVLSLGLICLLPLLAFSQEAVRNPDKPAKGIWNAGPELVWSVDEAKGEILSPDGVVALTETGMVFYFDDAAARVHAFDAKGTALFSFGRKGEGPGEFKNVWGMSVQGDTLVVYDQQCYHLYDLKGGFLKTIRSPGESEGLVTPDLLLCSLEEETSQSLFIHKLSDQSKKLLKRMKSPTRLTAEGGGLRLRVRDRNMIDALYAASAKGRIVFGQSAEYHFFITDQNGTLKGSFGIPDRKPPLIPQAYKEGRYVNLKVNGATVSPGMLSQLTKGLPDKGPFFNQVIIDDQGLILVMLPEYQDDFRRQLDLFSPDGRYLYRGIIEMPKQMPFNNAWSLRGDCLVMFTEGPDDEGTLKKFRIRPIPGE